jgi:hypothetical protein
MKTNNDQGKKEKRGYNGLDQQAHTLGNGTPEKTGNLPAEDGNDQPDQQVETKELWAFSGEFKVVVVDYIAQAKGQKKAKQVNQHQKKIF